jgi:hypothetical protein
MSCFKLKEGGIREGGRKKGMTIGWTRDGKEIPEREEKEIRIRKG